MPSERHNCSTSNKYTAKREILQGLPYCCHLQAAGVVGSQLSPVFIPSLKTTQINIG